MRAPGARAAGAGTAPVVRLPQAGTVLSWDPDPNDNESLTNTGLLAYWGITKGQKLYHYPAR